MADDKNKNQPSVDKQQLQQRILRSVRPDMGDKTGKWVIGLQEGASDKIEVSTQFDEDKAGQFPDDMRSWIDKMFDDFQRYEPEYNKAQTNPDMRINSERPAFMHAGSSSGLTSIKRKSRPTNFFKDISTPQLGASNSRHRVEDQSLGCAGRDLDWF